MLNSINLEFFMKMLEIGTKSLSIEHEYINNLNVFPIPDADTGINMKTTSLFAFNYLSQNQYSSFSELYEVYSKQLLLNARGNSGVIFSQIMKGFCESLKDLKEVKVNDLKKAFLTAKESAYKSVYNPIEGTILTVIKDIYENTKDIEVDSINEFFSIVIEEGEKSLLRTKEILPDLKKLNVVDSGAYGLMSFLKGMNAVVQDNVDEYIKIINKNENKESLFLFSEIDKLNEELGFGYCSEVVVKINSQINPKEKQKKWKYDERYLKKELEKIGNSLVFVKNNDLFKIHIHTEQPYKLLELAQKFGEFEKIKIENMTNQFLEKVNDNGIKYEDFSKEIKILFTAPTQQMADILLEQFEDVNYILTEYSTPSVQDFIEKITSLNSKNILVLLDDSNMSLAMKEVKNYFSKKINVEFVVFKNYFEILNAISHIEEDLTLLQNKKILDKLSLKQNSIIINRSLSTLKNSNIKQDDKYATFNKEVVRIEKKYLDILKWSADFLINKKKDANLIYVIYGKNSNTSDLKILSDYIFDKYGLSTEIKKGNQTNCSFYIGLL